MADLIKITTATNKDIKLICEINQEVLEIIKRHRSIFFGRLKEFLNTKEYYLRALKDKNSAIFVAELQNQVVGYAYISLVREPDDLINIPYLNINELAVKQKYRQLGIGKALMNNVYKWAKKKKVRVLQLAVWEFNQKTIKFYQELGFKTIMRKMEKILKIK